VLRSPVVRAKGSVAPAQTCAAYSQVLQNLRISARPCVPVFLVALLFSPPFAWPRRVFLRAPLTRRLRNGIHERVIPFPIIPHWIGFWHV